MKKYIKPELILESLISDKEIANSGINLIGDSEGETIEVSNGQNWKDYLN